MAQQDFTILTPYAAAIVWNYADRLGTDRIKKEGVPLTQNQEVDQVVLSTLSLKSIITNKTKSTASGTFEMRLAPTKNWITVIGPGSWMVLLMSRSPITRSDLEKKANPDKVKWFGRVNSVRVSTGVNQRSGARMTEYIVTGTDWAQIFNTTIYIDPALAGGFAKNSPIGNAAQLIYQHQIESLQGGLPSSSENIEALLKVWGKSGPEIAEKLKDKAAYITKPIVNFTIPLVVKNYFGFESVNLAEIIKIKSGPLNKLSSQDEYNDSYDNEVEESVGIILPSDVLGQHNFWNVMLGQSNQVINELITDLRWDNGQAKLALYKRIRPFLHDIKNLEKDQQKVGDKKSPVGANISRLGSLYENLRRVRIPLHEVVSFNAGTNWRDKINFIEVQLDRGLAGDIKNPQIKLKAQFFDEQAFGREGLRTMIARCGQLPTAGEDSKKGKRTVAFALDELFGWKYLLKEWYFNTHRMLNGSMIFIGQDKYIQAGDNIIVDARIIGPSYNINQAAIDNRGRSFLTAHVETVSHNFSVNDNGTREWFTTVQFVRGIITDTSGKLFAGSDGMVEQDTTVVGVAQELNNANMISTSTDKDPD